MPSIVSAPPFMPAMVKSESTAASVKPMPPGVMGTLLRTNARAARKPPSSACTVAGFVASCNRMMHPTAQRLAARDHASARAKAPPLER